MLKKSFFNRQEPAVTLLYSLTQFAHGERNGLRKSQLP